MKLINLLQEDVRWLKSGIKNQLDGLSQKDAIAYINKVVDVGKSTKKVFHDAYEDGVEDYFLTPLAELGTQARPRETDTNTGKMWALVLPYRNDKNQKDLLHVKVIQSRAKKDKMDYTVQFEVR